jgi:superfamily II DNA helicase RecQ
MYGMGGMESNGVISGTSTSKRSCSFLASGTGCVDVPCGILRSLIPSLQLFRRPVDRWTTVKPEIIGGQSLGLAEAAAYPTTSELAATVSRAIEHALDQQVPRLMEAVAYRVVTSVLSTFRRELLGSRTIQQRPVPSVPVMPAHPTAANGVVLLHGLRHLLNKQDAMFRSVEQHHACYLVASRRSDVAFIAPCDAGKSMAYQLPIFCADGSGIGKFFGINIVVVPYIGLAHDLLKAVSAMSIPGIIWTPDRPTFDTVTIIVSDSALHPLFQATARSLSECGRLVRVVLDEFHVYITEQSFRHCLPALSWLQELKAPVVYLSATVPPEIMNTLQQTLGMQQLPETIRLNAPRLRASLSAAVVPANQRAARIQSLVAAHCGPAGSRAIVFAYSVADVCRLASQLKCPAFYSSLLTQEKAAIMEQFAGDGETNLICSTSALAAGVSIDNIALIVHAGFPPDAIVYEQEIGRGGRNGQPFHAALLYDPQDRQVGNDSFGGAVLRHIVTSKLCLRSVSEYLTGSMVTCAVLAASHGSSNVEWCSNCTPGTWFGL